MTRRLNALFVLFLLLLVAAPASDMSDLNRTKDLIEFNRQFNIYFRTFMGCPKGAVILDECAGPRVGGTDYAAGMKVEQLAQKLWPGKQ